MFEFLRRKLCLAHLRKKKPISWTHRELSPDLKTNLTAIRRELGASPDLIIRCLTLGFFIKIMLCLYALALGTAQLFNLRTYRPLVIPLGLFLLVAALRMYPSISEHMLYLEEVQPFISSA